MSIFESKVFVESIPMWMPANTLKGIPVGSYKIASKIKLEKGNTYAGTSYVDMLNKALFTSIKEGYIKSTYPLDMVGLGDAIAWFVYFDGVSRKSGKDGEYYNTFISKDEILETCVIYDINEYRKKRTDCRPIRFVFIREDEFSCKFEGIFYQESINVYKKGNTLIGENVLKRYKEWEQYL